ncbi:Sec-independent protein translocase subunit TatA/TatB [Microbacterium hydrothermale]|uniref:Sec-independent protein translocase subunit TatA/TatB n=1 Tax=Microbacterium hydrothermale TaxID=857427 RepID=UPI00197C910E|nr:Sec-independent protein translocase TatB [Microbacterium hydrothermale]
MFGLSLEKLLLVGLIAAVIIGPHRLPGVVERLATVLRQLRRAVDSSRERAAIELGVPVDASEWRALDPRRYDPRRIIAEALAAPAVAASAPHGVPEVETDPIAPTAPDAVDPLSEATDATLRRIRVGTSAHPRWIEVPVDAASEDPAGADAPAPDALAPDESARIPLAT